MPYGRFTYRVERTRIVPPTATWVTDRVGYDRLVLSACHPLYSAAQRIVVFARLEQRRGPRAEPPDSWSFPNSVRVRHPIIHPASDDDLSHMTVLALRYASRHRVARVPGSTRSRFGRDVRGDRVITMPMTDSRTTQGRKRFAPRIERDDYTVDATEVADAIVARLLAGRSARDADE